MLAKGPADEAGVRQGQTLTAIDGKSLQGLHIHQVHELIRGSVGSRVQLTVEGAHSTRPSREAAASSSMAAPREGPSSTARMSKTWVPVTVGLHLLPSCSS